MNQTRNWLPVVFLVCLGVVAVSPIPSLAATTIAITTAPQQPDSNQIILGGANLDITADAIPDEGRTISKVEFFHDETPIGSEVTATPYKVTWENVPAGIYTLVVKATDDNNVETEASILIRAIAGMTVSEGDCTDAAIAAATPRKILYLGDSLTDDKAVRAIEAYRGADMSVTTAIAFGCHTIDGTSPCAPYGPTDIKFAEDNKFVLPPQPFLTYMDGDPSPRLKPTKWQYYLEPRDESKYPGYGDFFIKADKLEDPDFYYGPHYGHVIEDFDGVVVALGTNDGMFFEEGGSQIPTSQWKSENIQKLLNWLQPSANRPVIWVLPHFENYPNSNVPDGAYYSSDPHACFLTASGFFGYPNETIPLDPAFCKDMATLDELPNATPMPPELATVKCGIGLYLDSVENLKACLSAAPDDPVGVLKSLVATTAEIHRQSEASHQKTFTIRNILLDLEKTHPYLYVAPDLDDLIRYVSGGAESIYNHITDGTHWDPNAREWWAEYLSYWGRRLTNIPACRNALKKTRTGGALDMRDNYDSRIVEHVLSP